MGSVTLSMVMISAGFRQGAKRHGEVCEVFPLAKLLGFLVGENLMTIKES